MLCSIVFEASAKGTSGKKATNSLVLYDNFSLFIIIEPLSAFEVLDKILSRVVLPEPLGPKRPKILPFSKKKI